MKFALLSLLQERPMHGYEMMKALEEKSGGFYSPSAGSVYPTLQMLEDRGLVTSQEVEGKKVYNITDAGRASLADYQKSEGGFGGPPWAHGNRGHRGSPEMQALRSEAMEVARLFAIAGKMSFRDQDPERITRLRSILEQARKELSEMIYGTGSKQEQASAPHVDEA
jgi:DNA-binding PadR family transcriptional regulator